MRCCIARLFAFGWICILCQTLAIAQSKSSNTSAESEPSSAASRKVSTAPIGSGAKAASKSEPTAAEVTTLRKVERKELVTTASSLGGTEYALKYKLQPGLVIRSEVTHLAKTDTKIDSTEQNSNSRTVSQKSWNVVRAEKGQMTFEYRITDIDMSQQIGTGKELRYSSKDKHEPPRQFQAAADSVGKLISTVTIDEQGMIVARSDDSNPPNLGMGDITVPLPATPIAVGATWEIPRELHIRRDDGTIKKVRFSEFFRLDKVSAGVATIAVRSEMLTAITDPKEEAQVLQQLSNGTIRFDIDAGRMVSKELAWDKTVVGFSGDGSVMDYSARLEEQVVDAKVEKPSQATASKSTSTKSR
ncbi:MAG: hypothetical protein ABL921_07770 [Pirellula sp.]